MPATSEKQRRAMWAAHEGHSTLGIPQLVGREFVKADSEKKRCGGVVIRAPGPVYLLIQRADNGLWEQPGGHAEGEETGREAAERECFEETGFRPEGLRFPLRVNDGEVVYTTYLQDVPEPFVPTVNAESKDFRWCSMAELPSPIHDEVRKSLDLITGNEMDIAKRIAAGDLLSPQPYENVLLFDVRVTGTGTSYRPQHQEFVYRPPENFLTEEFVARCNGLPLIFEHPQKRLLDTEEYRDRAIGTVIHPYIDDALQEVWGVAKVFDLDGAQLMLTSHGSTSPAVVFRDAGSTETVEIDGQTVLIEGKPSYLDHLAICAMGVWDKGGEPSGINIGEPIMTEETKKEVEKADEMPAWADSLVKKVDSVCSRMDAIENKGGDTKPAPELKADSEEKKEEKADSDEKKEDKEARADSVDVAALRAELATVNATLAAVTAPMSNSDRDALATAQARADAVAQMFGDSVTPPLHGESPLSYRKRLASKFQKHSPQFKDVKLDAIEGPTFDLVEKTIYADAHTAALSPAEATTGRLIPMVERDSAGRQITRFAGDIKAFMAPFMAPGQTVAIRRPQGRV